jgi:hypothetical protein
MRIIPLWRLFYSNPLTSQIFSGKGTKEENYEAGKTLIFLELTLKNKTKGGDEMHSKTYLLVAFVLVLAMGMGCSSGSSSGGSSNVSSSGGGSSQTIVGTWSQVSSTDPIWWQQITFNANGTGQDSSNISFTWTQTGNQITVNYGSGNLYTFTYVLSPDGKTSTASGGGTTAAYKRA